MESVEGSYVSSGGIRISISLTSIESSDVQFCFQDKSVVWDEIYFGPKEKLKKKKYSHVDAYKDRTDMWLCPEKQE